MSTMASQITSLTIVYSTIYSGVDQRKHQSSASLAFVRGIHGDHAWVNIRSVRFGIIKVTNTMVIFDKYRRSLVALTHVKYECDSNDPKMVLKIKNTPERD